MSAKTEATEKVVAAAKSLFQSEGRDSSVLQGSELSQGYLAELADRGLIRRGGSGYGDGWEIDNEVAQALGLSEFDDS